MNILLFVYGTLKRGGASHSRLAGQEFVGEVRTAPRYRLYQSGWYPCMVESAVDGRAVKGELWRVEARALRGLDEWEGVPALFDRKPITLQSGTEAFAYLYQREVSEMANLGEEFVIPT